MESNPKIHAASAMLEAAREMEKSGSRDEAHVLYQLALSDYLACLEEVTDQATSSTLLDTIASLMSKTETHEEQFGQSQRKSIPEPNKLNPQINESQLSVDVIRHETVSSITVYLVQVTFRTKVRINAAVEN